MSFRDCINSAREQGVLSAEEAEDLIGRYEAYRRAHAGDAAKAKTALADEFAKQAIRREQLADMMAAKQDEIAADLSAYRGPDGKANVYEAAMRKLEHFGFTGYSSVKGRSQAVVALIHGQMADVLTAFERNFYTGLRHDKPLQRDVVREVFGEATGKPETRAFGRAVSDAFEDLRQRFNAAGGDMEKIDGYMPQFHEPLAVRQAGFERWRDFILPKLDLAKMKDPLTGGPLTPDRLGESLKAVYDAVVTDGVAGRTPTLQRQGKGALANRRRDHRFLHFQSADDWLAYDREFGHGDPVKAIFQHINAMARDIAALEVLGPNPTAMIEWVKQVVLSEHGKALTGQDSLFRMGKRTARGEQDAGQIAAQRIEDLFNFVRGRDIVSQQLTDFFSNIRNVLTSAQLGSAVVTAAATDPAIEAGARRALGMSQARIFGSNATVYLDTASRYFEQVPVARQISKMIDHMTGAPRDHALRSGMIADEFLHIMGDQARYVGTLSGSSWSRWLADRTVTVTGLTPLTEARRAVFQLELQGFVADLSDKGFDKLPAPIKAKLEGYGIGAQGWDSIRTTLAYRADPNAAGMIRPADVAARDADAAAKYVEMILGETERAVPSGTLRSRAFFVNPQRGKFGNELMESFLQYRSFGLSMMTLQLEALAHEGGLTSARGAGYAAQMFILTTLGGAAALQLKSIANGRDPQNMKDVKFWMAAMATGGGFGIAGDFLFADQNRFGHSLGETLAGPTVGFVGDLMKFVGGNVQELAQGKDTNAGKEAVDLAGRYTPFLSTAWQTRLAFKRLVIDQLQYQLDPHAVRRWRAAERKALKERGQGAWWPQGELGPARAPDWSRAVP